MSKNTSLVDGAKGPRGHNYNRPNADKSLSQIQNGKGSGHGRITQAFRSSPYWCPTCGKGPTACKCPETYPGEEDGLPAPMSKFLGTPALIPARPSSCTQEDRTFTLEEVAAAQLGNQ
jgi:hypothetical protein